MKYLAGTSFYDSGIVLLMYTLSRPHRVACTSFRDSPHENVTCQRLG